MLRDQILVMAPTRELAKQVSDTFGTFAAPAVNVLSVYGGTPIYPQGLFNSFFLVFYTIRYGRKLPLTVVVLKSMAFFLHCLIVCIAQCTTQIFKISWRPLRASREISNGLEQDRHNLDRISRRWLTYAQYFPANVVWWQM